MNLLETFNIDENEALWAEFAQESEKFDGIGKFIYGIDEKRDFLKIFGKSHFFFEILVGFGTRDQCISPDFGNFQNFDENQTNFLKNGAKKICSEQVLKSYQTSLFRVLTSGNDGGKFRS